MKRIYAYQVSGLLLGSELDDCHISCHPWSELEFMRFIAGRYGINCKLVDSLPWAGPMPENPVVTPLGDNLYQFNVDSTLNNTLHVSEGEIVEIVYMKELLVEQDPICS